LYTIILPAKKNNVRIELFTEKITSDNTCDSCKWNS
jgi:hypothetical protein